MILKCTCPKMPLGYTKLCFVQHLSNLVMKSGQSISGSSMEVPWVTKTRLLDYGIPGFKVNLLLSSSYMTTSHFSLKRHFKFNKI